MTASAPGLEQDESRVHRTTRRALKQLGAGAAALLLYAVLAYDVGGARAWALDKYVSAVSACVSSAFCMRSGDSVAVNWDAFALNARVPLGLQVASFALTLAATLAVLLLVNVPPRQRAGVARANSALMRAALLFQVGTCLAMLLAAMSNRALGMAVVAGVGFVYLLAIWGVRFDTTHKRLIGSALLAILFCLTVPGGTAERLSFAILSGLVLVCLSIGANVYASALPEPGPDKRGPAE